MTDTDTSAEALDNENVEPTKVKAVRDPLPNTLSEAQHEIVWLRVLAAERDALRAEVERLREGPVVKPLEWAASDRVSFTGRGWEAETPSGRYDIVDTLVGDRVRYRVYLTGYPKPVLTRPNLEAAKAAAQADYEARIRAALSQPPAQPTLDAAAIREAALKEAAALAQGSWERWKGEDHSVSCDVTACEDIASAILALIHHPAPKADAPSVAEIDAVNRAWLKAIEVVSKWRNAHSPGPVFKAMNETMGALDDERRRALLARQKDET